MDVAKFYGRHRNTFVRNVPDDSDDSELSDEDDPIDETWRPVNNRSDTEDDDDDVDDESTGK